MKRDPVIFLVVALAISLMLVFAYKMTGKSPLTVAAPTGAGKPAPDFTLQSIDGQTFHLADLRGKAVVVNFWATWCEPCKIEIPWLIEMQNKYGAKGFTVLGVAMDDEGKSVVAPFVQTKRYDVNGQQLAMNYPIVIGNDDIANKFGGLLGYPTSVLFDKNGKQVKRITGLISYDEITKMIEGQL